MKSLFLVTCPITSSILLTLAVGLSTTNYEHKNKFIGIILLLIGLCIYAHRVPENLKTLKDKNKITSPSYGTVSEISNIEDYTRICIYLALSDVHVQYLPIDGTIIDKKYKPGEFNPAHLIKKGEANERMETYIKPDYNNDSTIIVNQIAGVLARAVINFTHQGEYKNKGELMGIIQFGSRVDIYVPTSDIQEITTRVGETVQGPETCLMILK